mmetsp:Transcript_11065/g.15542  ORF Transcript_11065/g.15542 Transcript_11065/m.15542 type:complete len:179 (-) Transcript_11065:240-776(-)
MATRLMALSRLARQVSRSRMTSLPVARTAMASFSTSESLIPGVGKGKTSTGLVGLAVDHEAVPKMIVKYQALLDKMAESDMPEDAHYRIIVEKYARFRIKAAQENLDDPEKVEELCNCGQVEELVQQADDEMEVLDMYLRTRMWEQINVDVDVEENPSQEDEEHVDWEDENQSADTKA